MLQHQTLGSFLSHSHPSQPFLSPPRKTHICFHGVCIQGERWHPPPFIPAKTARPVLWLFVAFVCVDYLKLFHLQQANKGPYEDIERGTVGRSCAPIQLPCMSTHHYLCKTCCFKGNQWWHHHLSHKIICMCIRIAVIYSIIYILTGVIEMFSGERMWRNVYLHASKKWQQEWYRTTVQGLKWKDWKSIIHRIRACGKTFLFLFTWL